MEAFQTDCAFSFAGDAGRITPRSVALYPPQSLVLEVAANGYRYITWLINGSTSIDFSRLTFESNSMRLVLSDTVSDDVGEYEADVHLNDGTVVILDFIVQPYGESISCVNNGLIYLIMINYDFHYICVCHIICKTFMAGGLLLLCVSSL